MILIVVLKRIKESAILGSLDGKRYLGQLMSYLDPVIQSSDWSVFWRCWHSNIDGWASTTFHNNCDGEGPTVTIIQVSDHIFGGYTNVSWNNGKYENVIHCNIALCLLVMQRFRVMSYGISWYTHEFRGVPLRGTRSCFVGVAWNHPAP